MKNPKALPIAEFETQIKGLVDELFIANLHFRIGTGLRQSWREYYPEMGRAHVFWEYTIHAHDTLAVLGLCRVYENTKTADQQCLTLRRFIRTVEHHPEVFQKTEFQKRLSKNPHVDYLSQRLEPPDANQIKTDKALCDDQAVKNLCDRRNKLIAHANYEFTVGKKKEHFKSNPLPYADIEMLIDRGFDIVNRYSGIFIATTHSRRLASQQDQDFLEVLKSLRRCRSRDD